MERKLRRHIFLILLTAAIYFLADISVRATGFLSFGSYVGIKNFLPATFGLQFGAAGILGGCIGCIVTAIFSGASPIETIFECITIAVVGFSSWILWHIGSTTHKIHFKRMINILKYIGIILVSGAICGGISFIFIPGGAFVPVFSAYVVTSLLIGVPVNTICNSILGVEPVLPPMYSVTHDVTGRITSDSESVGALNDMLEEFGMEKGLKPKRIFEMLNCIEELSIRILSAIPDAEIDIFVDYDDTFYARFFYDGKRYNPLHTSKDEDELDIMSLKLVKHRALRASYKYSGNKNNILIVL